MVDRILLVLKVKNLTASKFADEIGVQRSSISHILSGRNLPSLDLIQKVLKTYPEISSEWLLNGIGPMSKSQSVDLFTTENSEIPVKRTNEISLFDMENGINDEQVTEKQAITSIDNAIEPSLESNKTTVDVPASEIDHSERNKVDKQTEAIYTKTISDDSSRSEKKRSEFEDIPKTDKNIEKIVIFYNNKTFREYFPE